MGDIITLKDAFDNFIKGYKKLIILGIGNELRGDDALGSFIINDLQNSNICNNISDNIYDTNYDNPNFNVNESDIINNKKIILIDGGSAPENFTGLIKKEKPSHLLIIDAALMDTEPGTIKFVNKDEIADINASTHSMSLSFLINYLENYIDFEFLFIGIEPLSMDLGENLSLKVLKSLEFIKHMIVSAL